jgi:hypothetical protein
LQTLQAEKNATMSLLYMSAEKRRKEPTEHAGFLEAALEQSKSNIVQAAVDLQRRQQECSKASS